MLLVVNVKVTGFCEESSGFKIQLLIKICACERGAGKTRASYGTTVERKVDAWVAIPFSNYFVLEIVKAGGCPPKVSR